MKKKIYLSSWGWNILNRICVDLVRSIDLICKTVYIFMGNSTSTQTSAYENYISQQQSQLAAQQQQIDRLFQLSLNNQRSTLENHAENLSHMPNITPQAAGYVPTNTYGETPDIPQVSPPQILDNPKRQKLNPYKILGVPKKFDEKTLKKAYLKAAQRTHPDRGGAKDEFQKVSIAYALLDKKLKDNKINHSHTELRSHSQNFLDTQATENVQSDTERFDVDVFNKIYEENRIKDVYDDGYSGWMERNSVSDESQKPMFHEGFNKDLFNHEFEKFKVEHSQKNNSGMVKFEEPQVSISMKGKDALMTLGQGTIEDFSGDMNGLGYRDYKDAFTNSVLTVDPSSFNLEGRQRSVGSVKKERSNISYTMSKEDQITYEKKKRLETQRELQRNKRLKQNDEQHFSVHDQMHQRLLRKF